MFCSQVFFFSISYVGPSVPLHYAAVALYMYSRSDLPLRQIRRSPSPFTTDARTRGIVAYDSASQVLREQTRASLMGGSVQLADICIERPEEAPRPDTCALCGRKTAQLTRDHLWTKSRGGRGKGNFISVCYPCNSDKGNMDLFEWIECPAGRSKPVPIGVCKRYLLNAWEYCSERGLLDKRIKNAGELPFKLRGIPAELPLR